MISRIFIASSASVLLYAKQLAELLKEDPKLLPVIWDESGAVFDIAYSTHYKNEKLAKYLKEQHELETIYDNTLKKNIYLLCRKQK